MRLYLDDNAISALLIRLLRNAGHDVQLPSDVGLAGADDPVHLAQAIRDDRICISYDHEDLKKLHDLLMTAQGHHPGIAVIRNDNDRRRDLKPPDIVRALRNLEAANLPLRDRYEILNQWR